MAGYEKDKEGNEKGKMNKRQHPREGDWEKSLYSPFLSLFSLFWCLFFISQWVIGWFISCWRKAPSAFQNHMDESPWWCACHVERKCVVEMWLCEKEKRKEKRKCFVKRFSLQKGLSAKRKNVFHGMGEVRNHLLHMTRTSKMRMICLFSGVIFSSHGENDVWRKGKECRGKSPKGESEFAKMCVLKHCHPLDSEGLGSVIL